MSNLENKLRDLFKSDPKIHSVSFGVCTAHNTPGNYALTRDRAGNVIQCIEDTDGIDALHRLCGDERQPAPKRPELPMMTTRALPL